MISYQTKTSIKVQSNTSSPIGNILSFLKLNNVRVEAGKIIRKPLQQCLRELPEHRQDLS